MIGECVEPETSASPDRDRTHRYPHSRPLCDVHRPTGLVHRLRISHHHIGHNLRDRIHLHGLGPLYPPSSFTSLTFEPSVKLNPPGKQSLGKIRKSCGRNQVRPYD